MAEHIPEIIDTDFRSALRRLVEAGRLQTYAPEADTELEIAGILKRRDGDRALLFPKVKGFDIPVMGNFLCSQANCEAAFGIDFRGIRKLIGRALANPLEPKVVDDAPWKQNVHLRDIDIGALLPVLKHTEKDPGRFITAGIVIVKDPETGVYNASYHRLQLVGPDRTAVKLDFGRHLRLAFERAQRRGMDLPIAVCIGTDLGVLYTAATMGSQMPETSDEIKAAGGLAGRPVEVCRGVTQDLLIPAGTEIVLEGVLKHDQFVHEGPFGEFIGYMSADGDAPVFQVTSLSHRNAPIYFAINGFGRETVMLRKYVMEASLLKVLESAVPIVNDVCMTAGGLHRFHAVISLRKGSPQHDGLQRNAMLASFGALKDLDQVIAVDDDIDIHDPFDVEYALATRMEASRDLLVIPDGRGHEYVRVGRNGIRAKLAIDATVPFEQRGRYTRVQFKAVDIDDRDFVSTDPRQLSWLAGQA
ncbi:MAG: UbiD family decarboxylase [Pigmentiphaga sp.]|uniref:UbiD family decarboxylase n=1 Tax=Pigmentiphaga sp. TaxID=1977564 RepID=UPI0029B71E37|nr:UbiD family decarboxylase [Pigmentiphaga sp.]MDX3904634.1 UbiD family decarboxylase [Pigmentiphaga sp.]